MSGRATRTRTRRSGIRRLGESAFGLLLVARAGLMALVAAVLVVAGVWASWGNVSTAMAGDVRGTVRIAECGDGECSGPFSGAGDGGGGKQPAKVSVAEFVAGERGETLDVAVKPGSRHAVRTGPAGVLYAWVPVGGALLLASLVVAGGLRMRRTAWAMGLGGALIMGGAWALLSF
ncbi:hypothetical protein [Streptomyces cacaoi]|uniref:hypothetical protein n=1 Tax=Streptomyces cacaoi TaxID=1898 RepID=UPI003747BA7C